MPDRETERSLRQGNKALKMANRAIQYVVVVCGLYLDVAVNESSAVVLDFCPVSGDGTLRLELERYGLGRVLICHHAVRLSIPWDYQLKREFEIADSHEDQGFFQDAQTTMDLWTSLQDRYRQPDSVMADRHAAKIVSFQFKPQRTIAGNWAKIQDYRRRS
ncbi:hypothetical protein E4U57_005225 [Claviceps arundinis]|uniref:Uncharacterized protein n=1 Tax=Claviceps arundinis TaxID=1623583 RepID=A0ABQ7PIC0_9HYPO|nr:hypothetical protein E4U57_005225 [Claviceps arundinis]